MPIVRLGAGQSNSAYNSGGRSNVNGVQYGNKLGGLAPSACNSNSARRAMRFRVTRSIGKWTSKEIWSLIKNINNGNPIKFVDSVSVSLSGDGKTIAFGSSNYNSNTGTVHIYRLNEINNSWELFGDGDNIGMINGQSVNSYFGYCVSLSDDGNIIAVSHMSGIGAHIYRLNENNNNSWELSSFNTSPNLPARSISLSGDGNTVAFTAENIVYIYKFDNNEWISDGSFIGDGNLYGRFGASVSLSSDGNTLAIGAPHESTTMTSQPTNDGRVYIYKFDITKSKFLLFGETSSNDDAHVNYESIGKMIGKKSGGLFGESVSLSGDGETLAIGSRENTMIFRFNEINSIWEKNGFVNAEGKNISVQRVNSLSLSYDGNIIAIGTDGNISKILRLNVDKTVWESIQGVNGAMNVSLSNDGKTLVSSSMVNGSNVRDNIMYLHTLIEKNIFTSYK